MAQTYTRLLYHIVFSTKGREPWIDPVWRPELYEYIGGIVRNRKGDLFAAGGVADHVHLLLRLTASRAVSGVVRDIKANSSGWLHERGVMPFAWQDGYGAFTLSPNEIPGVPNYINNQESHHARESFRDEFLYMLAESGTEFDPERLWE